MVTGDLDGVFKLFTTVELVIAAGALFKRLIIAELLLDLWICVIPKNNKRKFECQKKIKYVLCSAGFKKRTLRKW